MWQVLFRAPLKTHRVPQEPFYGTARLFGTPEACFLHRISLPYRRSLFFAPSAFFVDLFL